MGYMKALWAEGYEMSDEQLSFMEAQERRDAGMASVDENADDEWKIACCAVVMGLATGHTFLAEDVRGGVADAGYHVHDNRALGPVMLRLAKEGLIEQAGFARAKSSNLSPKVLWRRR